MAKTHTVEIAHKAFPYYVDVEDDLTGDTVRAEKLARRGDTVEVSEADFRRGTKFGAFVNPDAEPEESPTEIDVATAPVAEIAEWIKVEKPTIQELVDLAAADPEVAQNLLEAESNATGGQPRAGLTEALTRVIANNS